MKKILLIILGVIILGVGIFYIVEPINVLRPVFHKDIINRYAPEFKLDPLFVTAIIKVESNFVRHARSPRGAIGLMQLMPATAQELAQERGYELTDDADLADPKLNIELGMLYLTKLRKEFDNNKVLMLSAYNGGIGNVRLWQDEKGEENIQIDDIPFKETRFYVKKVLRTYKWLKAIQKLTSVLRKKTA